MSTEDARGIESALRRQSEYHPRVMSMGLASPDVVTVRTGEQVAPLAGGGQFLRAVREGESWRFELVGTWVS